MGAASEVDDLTRAKLILEAALLVERAAWPRGFEEAVRPGTVERHLAQTKLDDLRADWADRAVELTPVASGWRFRVKPEFASFVQRMNPEKAPRYSRAVMETLAIIAYRQPCTRGDIEQIRGVTVSTHIIKALKNVCGSSP
jgi:segregation and condensation protein B